MYVAEYDSRGRLWPQLHARVLAGLLVAQITAIGYFSLKKFIGTVLLAPLPLLTIFYFQYAHARFFRAFQVNSVDTGRQGREDGDENGLGNGRAAERRDVPSMEELEEAYTPQCLKPDRGLLDENSRPLGALAQGGGAGASGRATAWTGSQRATEL